MSRLGKRRIGGLWPKAGDHCRGARSSSRMTRARGLVSVPAPIPAARLVRKGLRQSVSDRTDRPRPASASPTIKTAWTGGTCSHKRRTTHPASRRRASVSRSRAMFLRIFASQNAAFVRGLPLWSGQPCQKQPSTKTATRCLVKAMSIERRGWPGTGNPTRKRRPAPCSRQRSSISGVVPIVRTPRIAADFAGEGTTHPTSPRFMPPPAPGDRIALSPSPWLRLPRHRSSRHSFAWPGGKMDGRSHPASALRRSRADPSSGRPSSPGPDRRSRPPRAAEPPAGGG